MLLRVKASLKRCRLAEKQESPQFIAEVGQGGQQERRAGRPGMGKHAYISYHDIT